MELLASHVTPGALADGITFFSGVLLSHCGDTPLSLAQSCHYWRYCPVVSLLELLPSRVTPGALAQSCQFLNFRQVLSRLELLSSHVTPGDLTQ